MSIETYEPMDASMYCPGCGKQGTLMEESGAGDYYHGPKQACAACGRSFTDLHKPKPNPELAKALRVTLTQALGQDAVRGCDHNPLTRGATANCTPECFGVKL